MNSKILFTLVISLILFLQVFAAPPVSVSQKKSLASQTTNPNLIGCVQREHLTDGCGCSFSFKNDPTCAAYGEGENVWMNIDGRDVKLKLVSEVSVPKGEVRKGQRITRRYVARGVKVRIDTVVGRSYGEGNDYTGTITVVKGSREQTVKVVGSCGC